MRRVGIVLLLLLALVGVVLVTVEVGPGPSDDGTDGGHAPAARDAAAPGPGGDRPTARAAGTPSDDDLDPARSIVGRVTDEDDAPIAGARVTLHAPDPLRRVEGGVHLADFERSLAETTSRWDGTFALPVDTTEPQIVVAAKEGHVPAARRASPGSECALKLHPAVPVRVRIVDLAGKPVAGATIYACGDAHWEHDLPVRVATSDSEGRAHAAIRSGDTAVVRARGYAASAFRRSSDDHGDYVRTITLDDGSALAGVVVDGTGAPLAEAIVLIGDWANEPHPRVLRERVVTGADGTFRFGGVSPASVLKLRARRSGFLDSRIDVLPGRTDLRLVLHRSSRIRGVVVHEDGSPARGAVLTSHTARLDAEAAFEIADVTAGSQRICARWPDRRNTHSGSCVVDPLEGETIEDLRIVVQPDPDRSRVFVRVVDAEGTPVEGAIVYAYHRSDTLDIDIETGASRDIWMRVPPGTPVRVAAWGPSLEWPNLRVGWADAVTAAWNQEAVEPIVLRLGAQGKLTIRLEDAEGRDVPLTQAKISFDQKETAHAIEGAWMLHPAVPFDVRVEVPGFARRRVRVEAPHPPELKLKFRLVPEARVVGRVVASGGRAVPDGAVVKCAVTFDNGSTSGEATPGEDGRFVIDGLPPGEATIAVAAPDGSHQKYMLHVRRTVSLRPETTIEVGDLVLPPIAVVEGFVVDQDGHGIGGATVLFNDPDSVWVVLPRHAGPDGRFRARIPLRDDIRCFALSAGHGLSSADSAPDAARPMRIVLRPGGRVRIRRSRGQWGLTRARVVGSKDSWLPIHVGTSRVDDREHTFGGFPAGEVELVTSDGDAERTTRVTVVAGETVEARF